MCGCNLSVHFHANDDLPLARLADQPLAASLIQHAACLRLLHCSSSFFFLRTATQRTRVQQPSIAQTHSFCSLSISQQIRRNWSRQLTCFPAIISVASMSSTPSACTAAQPAKPLSDCVRARRLSCQSDVEKTLTNRWLTTDRAHCHASPLALSGAPSR